MRRWGGLSALACKTVCTSFFRMCCLKPDLPTPLPLTHCTHTTLACRSMCTSPSTTCCPTASSASCSGCETCLNFCPFSRQYRTSRCDGVTCGSARHYNTRRRQQGQYPLSCTGVYRDGYWQGNVRPPWHLSLCPRRWVISAYSGELPILCISR